MPRLCRTKNHYYMTKSLRNILLALLCLASLTAMADKGGIRYRNWVVKAQVNDKNQWTVEEHENVTFTQARHGIYRYIDGRFYITLNTAPEGETPYMVYKSYNGEVELLETTGGHCEAETIDNKLTLKLGSNDKNVEGDHDYTITFRYTYPSDKIKTRDFIFHTLKPNDIKEVVDTCSFDLSFEKPLPADIAKRAKVYIGPLDDKKEARVENLIITPTRISGTVYRLLPEQELTLYAELPEGYWNCAYETASPIVPQVFAALALLCSLLLVFYQLKSRKDNIVKTVELYPPENITPSEVGMIIDGFADSIDLTALIPWLAHRGYITLREETMGKDGKTDIVLLKTQKSLPADAPEYHHRIMDMLFPDGSERQRMSRLGQHPEKVEAAKDALSAHFTGERKLREISTLHIVLMAASFLFSTLAIASNSYFEAWSLSTILVTIVSWTLPGTVAYFQRLGDCAEDSFRTRKQMVVKFVIRGILFFINLMLLWGLNGDDAENFLPLWFFMAMVLTTYVSVELTGRLEHDTPYRNALCGSLLGFRDFLNTAEIDRINMLCDEDPHYFFNVLPYAMVFGLTDKWKNIFNDIELKVTEKSAAIPFDPREYERMSQQLNEIFESAKKSNEKQHGFFSRASSFLGHSRPHRSSTGGASGGGGSW